MCPIRQAPLPSAAVSLASPPEIINPTGFEVSLMEGSTVITSITLRTMEQVDHFTEAITFLQQATDEEVFDSTNKICAICHR